MIYDIYSTLHSRLLECKVEIYCLVENGNMALILNFIERSMAYEVFEMVG